jgi:hypothetical protein
MHVSERCRAELESTSRFPAANDLDPLCGHMELERILTGHLQRQTVVSQFFQLDRLVVEGGKTVRFKMERRCEDISADKFTGKAKRKQGRYCETEGPRVRPYKH